MNKLTILVIVYVTYLMFYVLAVLFVLFVCQDFCQDFLWGFKFRRGLYAYIRNLIVHTLDYLALYHPNLISMPIDTTFNTDHHVVVTECLEVLAFYYFFLT